MEANRFGCWTYISSANSTFRCALMPSTSMSARTITACVSKVMSGRFVLFVHLQPTELHPGQAPFASPVLYEPKFASAFGDDFRLQGWEVTEGRAWCAQAPASELLVLNIYAGLSPTDGQAANFPAGAPSRDGRGFSIASHVAGSPCPAKRSGGQRTDDKAEQCLTRSSRSFPRGSTETKVPLLRKAPYRSVLPLAMAPSPVFAMIRQPAFA